MGWFARFENAPVRGAGRPLAKSLRALAATTVYRKRDFRVKMLSMLGYLTIENGAALLGILNVGLLVRRSIWNYPFGIASVALYGYVFLVARLYSDAILQIYFVAVQFYGWWNWLHGRSKTGDLVVETMSARQRTWLSLATLAIALSLGWLFRTYTNAAAPWMDAALAATSVTAQYLLSIRKIENWILWIAVDVFYIGLYWWKGLHSTAGLYTVFLVLSIAGLFEWMKARSQLTVRENALA
jgi:nicotinamide mononucleotide transporter